MIDDLGLLGSQSFVIALATEGFVTVRFAQEDAFFRGHQTMADVCQVSALHAYGMGLVYIIGNRHECRHRTERYAFEVHIQTGTYDTYTAVCQLLAYIHNAHVEELRLVNTHYVNIVHHEQDILTAVHGCGLNDIAVVAHLRSISITTLPGINR